MKKGIKLLAKLLSLVLICTSSMQYVVRAESTNVIVNSKSTESVSDGNGSVVSNSNDKITGRAATLADTTGVILENYYLEIGGKEITGSEELPVVSDGDTIIMGFSWSIPNDDRETSGFTLDLNVKNIQIVDTSGFLTKDAVDVGEYTVKNGVLTVNFFTETDFFKGDNRYGGLRVEGSLDVDENVLPTDSVIDITMGSVSMELPYLNKASAELEKTAGKVQLSDGKLIQTFNVVIKAVDGNVTVNSFNDVLGSGFSNMSNITVVNNSAERVAGLVVGSEYTLDDINNILSNSIIDKDASIEFQYTVEVDKAIYDDDEIITAGAYDNTASIIYNNKVEAPVTDTTTTTVNKPVLTKTGDFSEDYSSITWKLSVDLKDFSDLDFYDPNIIPNITDTPMTGLVGAGESFVLNASDFVYNTETKTYDYYYTTEITEEYRQSVSKKDIYNYFEIIVNHPDLGEHPYVVEGKETMPGRNWIEKSVVSYEPGELITWKIELTDIPEGITSMQVKDVLVSDAVSSSHEFQNMTITLVDEDGVETILRKDYEDTAKNIATTQFSYDNTIYIKFDNGYTASKYGQDLTIYITSVPTDKDLLDPFKNVSEVYYVDNGTRYSWRSEAQIKDTSQCLDKEGKVAGKTSIKYTMYVDMTKLDVEVGKPIYIEDVLPEGLVLDTSTGLNGVTMAYINKRIVNGVVDGATNTWKFHSDLEKLTTITYEDNKIKIEFIPNADFYNSWMYDKNPSTADRSALRFEYVTNVEDVDSFIRNSETVTFTNTVTGEYDGLSLGEASCDVDLTPFDVATKAVDDTTYIGKDIVKYTIDINEKKLDLSGDTLVAQDILGRGLAYVLEDNNYPIIVEEYTDEGEWVPLEYRTDYTYYFATEENSLVFTIPDEKYLRISYYVKINIRKEGYYTEEVAANTFKLQGINNFTDDSAVILSRATLRSLAWVDYKVGSIELYKYWSNGDMIALPEVEFALYETVYDGQTLSLGNVIRDDIVVNEQGRVTIDNLNVDVIYALMETKTPIGYESNNRPYYFILPGDNMPSLPSGYPIQYFVDGSVLYYENHKVDTGELELSKSIEGITDWDSIKDNIEFTIKKGERIIEVIKGTDLDADTHSIVLPINVGDYEITEKITIPEHYTCETTYSYTVGNSGETKGNGTVANTVTVAEGETTKINFNNKYEFIDSTLSIIKEHSGLDWDSIKDSIKFEIYSGDNWVKTVNGSDLDSNKTAEISLYPGNYTIKEIVTNINGYSCVTEYQVNTSEFVKGNEAGLTINSEENSTVIFRNTYSELTDYGILVLTKEATGLDWSTVKDNIKFEIYNDEGLVETVLGTALNDNKQISLKLEPGNYTVKEIIEDISGYTCTTEYKVNTSDLVEGTSTNVVITSENTVNVTFNNNYVAKKGTLVLEKNYTTLDWDVVSKNIKFEIYDNDVLVKTVLGTELDANRQFSIDLDPNTYTVKEIITGVDGYTCTTTYVIADNSTQGTEANVGISSEQTTTVTFNNKYEAKAGELVLKKEYTTLEWSQVKPNISFKVYRGTVLVQTIFGTDFDSNGELHLSLEPGTYTVKEIVTPIDGYTCTTQYQVASAPVLDGTETDLLVKYGQTTNVKFINNYTAESVKASVPTEDKKPETALVVPDMKDVVPDTGENRKDFWYLLLSLMGAIGTVCFGRKLQLAKRDKHE